MSAAPKSVRKISDPVARTIARFMCKVRAGATPDACSEWIAAKDKDGYGTFQFRGLDGSEKPRKERASCVALAIDGRPLSEGALARHTCDNAGCVNVRHLVAGTTVDNVLDRVSRGRSAKGETHGRATSPNVFEAMHSARRKRFSFRGEELTLREIADRLSIPFKPLRGRVGRGWDIERAISEPAHHRG